MRRTNIGNGSTSTSELFQIANQVGSPLTAVYSRDQLEDVDSLSKGDAFIINLESSDSDGSHWVSLIAPSPTRVIYFDSFGLQPPVEVINLCAKFGVDNLDYNDVQIQSVNEAYCGQYCLDFIKSMMTGKGSIIIRYNEFIKKYKEI